MELEQLILWTVCLACGLLWFRSITLPSSQAGGWVLVSGGILGTTLMAIYIVPTWAAWWGGSLWVMFVLIPVLGIKWVDRLCIQERYDRASQLALGLCWLHPADGWVERVRILRGMALAQSGNLAVARQLLNPQRALKTVVDLWGVALWYSIHADWTGLLAWFRLRVSESVLRNSPDLMALYLRALGETGKINELIQEWELGELRWTQRGAAADFLDRLRVYVWAFSGRVAGVQHCLERGVRSYPPETQQFWRATAQMAAGQRTIARVQLLELQSHADFPLQQAIAWRLSQRPAPLNLTPASLRILSRLEADTQLKKEFRSSGVQEFRISPQFKLGDKTREDFWISSTDESVGLYPSFFGQKRSNSRAIPSQVYATFFLIAANFVVFGLEVYFGGSENPQVLERLGAMIPERVWEGQWWRLVSATFLHFGVGHLVMNMLGLYVLGLSVEPVLGIRRYLLTYFTSGVGSMLVTAILAWVQHRPETFVVGASGAVMGLVGAIVAILLASWRRDQTRLAQERLRRIVLILGVQTIFDWLNPQVCFVCHLSGAILGLAIVSWLIRNQK